MNEDRRFLIEIRTLLILNLVEMQNLRKDLNLPKESAKVFEADLAENIDYVYRGIKAITRHFGSDYDGRPRSVPRSG